MTRRNTCWGLFLSLLALMAQLGWNARAPDIPRIEMAVLLGDPVAICHMGGGSGGQKGPAMPGQDCPMCPCCIGAVQFAPLPVPFVPLALPAAIPPVRFAATPPATAPPPVRFAIAHPRGPPTQA